MRTKGYALKATCTNCKRYGHIDDQTMICSHCGDGHESQGNQHPESLSGPGTKARPPAEGRLRGAVASVPSGVGRDLGRTEGQRPRLWEMSTADAPRRRSGLLALPLPAPAVCPHP